MNRAWQVLIADLKSSRQISARERPHIDRALQKAIVQVLRRHRARFRLVPQVLKGDELQAVLKPDAPALGILTDLRAGLVVESGRRIDLRAGLGCGTIQRLSSKGPFASEGEAFHRARAALERAKQAGGTGLTAWRTGDETFDGAADALLGVTDALVTRWTAPQWEAVAGRLQGKGLHDIARETEVSFQSVSKRLRAASWNEVQQAFAWLESAASRLGAAPGRIRRSEGESRHSPSRG
jgi:SatD family (SatD)